VTKTLHLGKMLYFCYLYSIVKNQINNKHWNTINLDGTIEAELKDFLWDLKFEIESFTFFFSSDGYDKEITSKGNKLTDEMRSIISDLKSGQYIIFKDIKAIGPDGKLKDLNPLVLKIE